MKLYFYILTIQLLTFKAYSQGVNYNLTVNYDIHYNTEIPNTRQAILYIDEAKTESIFIHGEADKSHVEQNEDDDMSFNLIGKGIIEFNFVNLVTDSLYSKELLKDPVILVETLPNMEWNLENETKQLDGLTVKKASLKFRGRQFTAWYYDAYPIPFGPWKFHGLPGLILEIFDETKRFHFVATAIKTFNEPESIDFSELIQGVELLDLKTYVDKKYDINTYIFKGRVERGVNVNYSEVPRNDIELKYEWETE